MKLKKLGVNGELSSTSTRLVVFPLVFIKILATNRGMTINEYLLSFARAEMPKKAKRSRVPNKRTEKALKEAEEGTGETYESIDEFWEAIGINPNED